MKRKPPCSSQRLSAAPIVNVGRFVGRHLLFVVRIVESRPLLFLGVPPDQFLALAPRRAVPLRRSAGVEDATVIWPGKAPAVSEQVFGVALERAVMSLFRINSAVDPS